MLLFEAVMILLWHHAAILTYIALLVYDTVTWFPFYEM
jgi:hypothetical protein